MTCSFPVRHPRDPHCAPVLTSITAQQMDHAVWALSSFSLWSLCWDFHKSVSGCISAPMGGGGKAAGLSPAIAPSVATEGPCELR